MTPTGVNAMPQETSSTLIEDLGDVIVVHVKARDMSEENIKAVQADVHLAAGASTSPVILDLANVKYVPSLALGIFVRMANSFKSKQQRFILAQPQATVRQALAITRLDRAMEIQESVDVALRAVRPG